MEASSEGLWLIFCALLKHIVVIRLKAHPKRLGSRTWSLRSQVVGDKRPSTGQKKSHKE